jgi:hypothetical protein
MGQFLEFFTFELRFRAKSLSTYVYFGVWLFFSFLCVASESFGPVGNSNGKVLLNGPFANSLNDSLALVFGLLIVAAIFGTSILRDFQRDTWQILFTKPFSTVAYLGGRWAASLVTTLFTFSGLLFGTFLGTFAPWADHTRIVENHLGWYVTPFFSIVVIQVFFVGSLFFAVAALTRQIVVVYLQGVALFMLYLVTFTIFSATRSTEHFWSGVLDPVGLLLVDRITRYWTVAEKNTLLLPWDFSGYSPGVFLYNRLLWSGVGLASLAGLLALFPRSAEALASRSQGKRAAKARRDEQASTPRRLSVVVASLPRVQQVFGLATAFAQYRSLCALRVRNIVREIPFWGITALMIVFAINNGNFAGRAGGVNVWPVTYLMLQAVEGSATLFFYIVATLYAAELVWRERDTHFDGIHDALPLRPAVDWLSKLTAIALVELFLLSLTLLVGVGVQTAQGYYHYEIGQYLKELYLVAFPQVLGFAVLSMFVQTLVSNKFVGHGIVIGIVVLQPILYSFGWENTLYLPGAAPPFIYSDMNGYGHYVPALTFAIGYWLSIFALLGVVSIAFARRGAEVSLRGRARNALAAAPALAPWAGLFLLAAAGSGGWYYYNAHVRNEYLNAEDRRRISAAYERDFKKYETLPQPKVTAVETSVDIFPEQRAFEATGVFTLQNKSAQPISEIHLTDTRESVKEVQFDRPFHLVSRAARGIYSIYALEPPMAPGDVVKLTFKAEHRTHGFLDGNEPAEFAYNGTFFDSGFLPVVGYDAGVELDDPRRRREQKLGPLTEMAHRGDPIQSRLNIFTPNADWITYRTQVSTSDDQIAIAPGYLVREWREGGRHHFEYSMGSAHILDFFAYLSGRYAVEKDVAAGPEGPVNLEVYYDPSHPYNVPLMLEASRAGLDYYGSQFSPYQFKQFRIMEFPRYRSFAQSFSNTVPFSEAIGFITRRLKPTDVDLTWFVTAHELGHQWWAHQLIGGRVEGSNMMSETLAQYSAYMLTERKYGKEHMRRVLRYYLDRYLRGRAGEVRHEPPLSLVQREPYVWYEKGGQIMYTLADTIGEERVNRALRTFLLAHRYANADNQADATGDARGAAAESQPYPDTRMLVAALRAETPPEYQYLIDDGFDRIVLYDNKAVTATSHKIEGGKYEVTLDVQVRKSQADGNGAETPMPLSDFVEVGVFSGKADEERPLHVAREKITAERQTFTIVVDEPPTRAGIDPYNKLIDRIPDDNLIDVTAQ